VPNIKAAKDLNLGPVTTTAAGKQARQLHPLTGAKWVLQIASAVKISSNKSLCSMVH
jgi:hypothetical protein